MQTLLRRNSDNVLYSKKSESALKCSDSKEKRVNKVLSLCEIVREPEEDPKISSKKMIKALKSTNAMVLALQKKPLRSIQSWGNEYMDCNTDILCLQKDGSFESEAHQEFHLLHGTCVEQPRFELEISCSHCSLVAQYRSQLLKNETEGAIKLLTRRVGSTKNSEMLLKPMPNIIVSSITSDEEDLTSNPHLLVSERGSSLPASEPSSASSSALSSPSVERYNNDVDLFNSQLPHNLVPSSLLIPNVFLSPHSASPPTRSNSVDLSILGRNARLVSINSRGTSTDSEDESSISTENMKTSRSTSCDPPLTTFVLRRPSRMESLSDLLRLQSFYN
ncbi:unnamed protein product [Angiostrongylus costaricensis]|uniref:SCA7 domain-containing protein n=1 Tax=Angiostrongylus costaricensis TaxID=334426 RepID=A0A0R3Q2E8_ANGCS|nr:unnamed protein product [Angiostrongylus costaricensis]